MINADFSRRVGKLMHTQVIESQNLKERLAFIEAIEKAKVFSKLSVKYRSIILKAEEQLES